MPVYEYRCRDCRAITSVLVRSSEGDRAPVCSRCGSDNLVRLLSRFATPRSEGSRMERMADPSSWGGMDENDPKSVSRFMKRMGREMGDEFRDGMDTDFDEMVDREMSGEGGAGGADPDGGPETAGGGTDSGLGDD